MARKSPPVANTGCKWPMFRIFNFSKSHSKRRLVSAAGNGNLRSSSDVIGTVDEKYPGIGVSSGRRYFSSKSTSNVKNDQVADPRNKVAKMVIDQRFTNQKIQGKDQLFDAVQILYSNKELFLKLLKDPNSMLVKQIHELPNSEVKKPYQALSHSSLSHNVQHIKPSHFLHIGRIKRKSRYVMKVRRKTQQRRTVNGAPYRFTCGCLGIEDGKKVNKSKIARISSSSSSSSRNTYNPTKPSEQDIWNNVHVEGSRSLSEMLRFRVEKSNRRANSKVRTNPLPDFKSFPRMPRNREHDSVTEEMKNGNNYHQILIGTKFGLQKERKNGFYSSSGQKTNDPPEAIVKIPSENFQLFGSDIRIRKSALGHNIHAHYDSPRDGGFKDTPTQNFDINNNTLGRIGTFLDSFSPEVASSSPSPSQRIVDNINMRNRIEHPSTEPVFEHFTKEDVTNSKMTLHKPDKSPRQVFEVTHFEDLIRPSLGLINNITSSKDILHYVMEILHSSNFKCDELFMKSESSTFDELNRLLLTSQLSSNKVLVHCVIETLIEVYKNNGFPPKILDIQPYDVNMVMVKEIITTLVNMHCLTHPTPITVEDLVEKDLAKKGSWLNIKVGIEDILIEVEEHVLQKLVLEIVIEMDI